MEVATTQSSSWNSFSCSGGNQSFPRIHSGLFIQVHPSSFKPIFPSGAAGGGTAMAVAHPLDVLRTRLVAQGEPKTYNGMLDAIMTMRRREGPRAFYKGLVSNLLQVGYTLRHDTVNRRFGLTHIFVF